MRTTISLALTVLMAMQLVPAAFGGEGMAEQIAAIPAGAKIQVHLNNKEEMRGTKGAVSNTGFTLVDTGKAKHQVAFDEVASVKQLVKTSHTTRNVLIGVGIGVAALGITAGILFRCGGLGCGKSGLGM